MTFCLVTGMLMILSAIAGLPEISEKLDAYWFNREEVLKIKVICQRHIDFVDYIELYGDFWFTKEEPQPRRVWRQKNAKCSWAPLPPTGRKMFSELACAHA